MGKELKSRCFWKVVVQGDFAACKGELGTTGSTQHLFKWKLITFEMKLNSIWVRTELSYTKQRMTQRFLVANPSKPW